VELYDTKENLIFPDPSNDRVTPVDFVPKLSQVACVLQCGGLWKGGKGWGVTWKLIQCVVKPREVVSVYGKCRVLLSDEERGAIDSQEIKDDEAPVESVFQKSEPQHSVEAEDSDEEGVPDIVAQEVEKETTDIVAQEDEPSAPKKKVVKKKAEDTEPEAPKKKIMKKKKVVAEEA
jgi:hypothetical protein